MTSRQRIEASLRHEQPDRTPVFEYVLLTPIEDLLLGRPACDYVGNPVEWNRQLSARGWEHALRQCATDRVDLACKLGHDMMYVVPNPIPPKNPLTPTSTPAELPDDPVERLRRRNELAALFPHTVEDESFAIYRFLQEEMERRGLDLPILAPAYAHGVWTDVDLMQTMVLDPEVAHEHFAHATGRSLSLINAYLDLGLDQIGIGGDFAGNVPLISPKLYREFIVPEIHVLSRHLHAAGAWAVNASDGDLWSVIEDFLLECEVDGYLEIDQRAGMDLRRLKTTYGDRVTFYGNLDCGSLLTFAMPEEVKRETAQCLEWGFGSGGHIFCVSNAITASVRIENYLAMINVYREVFGLEVFEL